MKRFIFGLSLAMLTSTSCLAIEVPPTLIQKISSFFKSTQGKLARETDEVSVLQKNSPPIDMPSRAPAPQFEPPTGFTQSREAIIANAVAKVVRNTCAPSTSECHKKIQEFQACLDRELHPPRMIEFATKICEK